MDKKLEYDAFSHYSNDFVRMKHLLLKDGDETFDMTALHEAVHGLGTAANIVANDQQDLNDGTSPTKRRRMNHASRPIKVEERKTRVSFEVHPSLMMYNLLFPEEASTLTNATLVEEDGGEK